jgi:hypothetical protein
MLLVLILGGAALASRLLTTSDNAVARARANTAALAEAKEALLGFASLDDPARPGELGFLPCPDRGVAGGAPEGAADATACGAQYQTVQGRLPWRTLGLEPARTRGGECLWYAVSGSHKAGTTGRAELLNPDSNGQLRLLDAITGQPLAGATAAERAVAVIVAPGMPLAGQTRTLAGGGATAQCGGSYAAAAYLDPAPVIGITNVFTGLIADAVTAMASGSPAADVNDQVLYITRAELASRIERRGDLTARLAGLTDAVARCLADYGRRNPGGAGDHRLPWPAPLGLADYRSALAYNDIPLGPLSGRVPDVVNDSNTRTGNSVARALTNCNATTVPEWTAERRTLWAHWKDHLFYAVANSFRPDATPTASCGTCLTVNGSGSYAAIVALSGSRLTGLGQVRDAPPDTDTRSSISNYLEGRNAANHPNTGGNSDYESAPASAGFNDTLVCIRDTLEVVPC